MKKLLLTVILSLALLAGCASVDHKETVGSLRNLQEHGEFTLVCRNDAGEVKWSETHHNALANEGEYSILDSYLRAGTAPTTFYFRLYNATPTLTSTLSTLASSEPATANGYAPASQSITRDATGWPTLSLVSSHYKATSKNVVITASGGTVGPVTYAAIATSSDNTGKLVAYAALSATRTLQSGDSLTLSYSIGLQ